MRNIVRLLAIASVTLLFSCSKQEQVQPANDSSNVATATVKVGQGKAIVRATDTRTKTITLDHSMIPGIMDAMAMEYPVSDSAMLHGVSVGDSVIFTLQDRGDENLLVTQITPIPKH